MAFILRLRMREEQFEEIGNQMQPQTLRFARYWSFVVLSTVAWKAFWRHANNHADHEGYPWIAHLALYAVVWVAHSL